MSNDKTIRITSETYERLKSCASGFTSPGEVVSGLLDKHENQVKIPKYVNESYAAIQIQRILDHGGSNSFYTLRIALEETMGTQDRKSVV